VQAAPQPDPDLARQRPVVDAFLRAARTGDLRGLLEVLDPEVVFRADLGAAPVGATFPVFGAQQVAERVLQTAPRFIAHTTPAIVNGQAGAMFMPHGRPAGVIGFTVVGGRIVEINLVADPAKLRHAVRRVTLDT
jgi:RNA polymerase sigma-70 factor (ECF subfamily)